MNTQFLSTRQQQRKVSNYLKTLGLHATCTRTKQAKGWQVNVLPMSVSKPVKMACKSLAGRLITVLIK